MQDPHAALEPLPADLDELLRRPLEPGRHHATVVVPDGAKPLPVAGIAPDDPALDEVADRPPVVVDATHCMSRGPTIPPWSRSPPCSGASTSGAGTRSRWPSCGRRFASLGLEDVVTLHPERQRRLPERRGTGRDRPRHRAADRRSLRAGRQRPACAPPPSSRRSPAATRSSTTRTIARGSTSSSSIACRRRTPWRSSTRGRSPPDELHRPRAARSTCAPERRRPIEADDRLLRASARRASDDRNWNTVLRLLELTRR